MGYVKVVKNRNYYKRFRVKYRRRRERKTNYQLRRRLITQDKRKFNAPKWRLVVRISNKDVVAQVVSAKMIGDQIICAAYAHELKRYGLKVGLTNYAACYCTGLLIARRLLKKMGLDQRYPGKKFLDGNKFISRVSNVKWQPADHIYRPFKCVLDTGLARCSTGARIFAILKGAVDGGLDVPHSMKRFPGYVRGKGKGDKDKYDPDVHRTKIFGGHVAEYMTHLKETDGDKYNKHFSQYIKEGIESEDLEELYGKIHRSIRKDPSAPPKTKRDFSKMKVSTKPKKLTLEERIAKRTENLAAWREKLAPKDEPMADAN